MFQCLPSDAEAELDRQPVGTVEHLMALMAFRDTWHEYHRAGGDMSKVETSPLMDIVQALDFEFAADDLKAAETHG